MGMRLTSLQRVGHTAVENNLSNASQRTILLKDENRLEQRLKEIPAEPGCYLMRDVEAVSYTHLTLPTTPYV